MNGLEEKMSPLCRTTERGETFIVKQNLVRRSRSTSATLPQARRERVGSRVAVDRVGVLLVGRASSSLGRVVVK